MHAVQNARLAPRSTANLKGHEIFFDEILSPSILDNAAQLREQFRSAKPFPHMVFDGLFDRFPTLRIVLVEHAFTWILPLMWRMDAIYEARKQWVDIKRKPSE